MIDKVSALTDGTEKDLIILQYRDVISWSRIVDMDNSKDREKITKEIVIRFAESIALWRLV